VGWQAASLDAAKQIRAAKDGGICVTDTPQLAVRRFIRRGCVATSVLFVCSANRFRSVVAEHLFRKMLWGRDKKLAQEIEVSSAGIKTEEVAQMAEAHGWKLYLANEGVPEEVVVAMQKRGMNLPRHQPKELDRGMVEGAGLIITMEEYHKREILTLYPSVEGRVFTLREFVENANYFLAEGPVCQFSPEYICTVITQIEECLSQGMDKFLYYLGEVRAEH